MNTNLPTLPDELGERISAYLDGELPPHEAAEVQRLLAEDPSARRFADELAGVSRLCHAAPAPVFTRDLKSSVMAEALRRQASGEGAADEADQVEPEGYYGLPLGKGSRGWVWAVVAAAAAVMIGFYGRPAPPSGTASFASNLRAMQQAVPGMQVVNFQATPEMYNRLRQRLALQPARRAQLPGALMTVSEPADPAPAAGEQLMYVDAEQAELDRLLSELSAEDEGSLVRVESDRPAQDRNATVAAAPAAAPGLRAVPLRVKVTPEQVAQLIQQQQRHAAGAGQRRIVVLRIQLKPAPAE